MKKLVIFYSFEGNTKLMAESIARATDADLLELKPRKEIKSKGFMKYVWGGKAAMMKAKPELLPLDRNPEDYDLLFIGSPVWAGTYAPSMNSFLSSSDLTDKKVALFCCHAGGKGSIFEKMREALKGNEFIGQIDFKDPLKHDTDAETEKAGDWAAMISLSAGDKQAVPDLFP